MKTYKVIIVSILLLMISLAIGIIGYKFLCGLTWVDSFLNASMILTGMGPVDEPENDAGKMFAGAYALYSGIIFLSLIGLITLPLYHDYAHLLNLHNKESDK
ncbi:MAG: hypothetical protein K2Q22_04525 [Cytophagales bacterium]|nr:hypothetical protein [Cytophagales bacterium]